MELAKLDLNNLLIYNPDKNDTTYTKISNNTSIKDISFKEIINAIEYEKNNILNKFNYMCSFFNWDTKLKIDFSKIKLLNCNREDSELIIKIYVYIPDEILVLEKLKGIDYFSSDSLICKELINIKNILVERTFTNELYNRYNFSITFLENKDKFKDIFTDNITHYNRFNKYNNL